MLNKTPDKVKALAEKIDRKLTENFPGTQFDISCGWRYNTEVKVEWTSGPTNQEVREVIGKYEHGYDIQRECRVEPTVKYFQVDLISTRRR